jgi:hypothetical protein
MADNKKDILSNLSTDIDQEKLLQYLQQQLSADQQHHVEKGLIDDPFAADAVEGLQQMRDKKKMEYMVEMLNRDLKKKTEKKKKRRQQLQLKDHSWLYLSVFIVIILIVICYFVIHYMKSRGQ